MVVAMVSARAAAEMEERDKKSPQERRQRRSFHHAIAPLEDDYDPAKPEYIIPATDRESADASAKIALQQIAKLEDSMAKREEKAKARGMSFADDPVLMHYRKIANQMRRSLGLSPLRVLKASCPICLETSRPGVAIVVLCCGHPLCGGCAAKCAAKRIETCPVCRHPHLLDPKLLAARSEHWRHGYNNWRSGAARGAAGEANSICEPLKGSSQPVSELLEKLNSNFEAGQKKEKMPIENIDRAVAHMTISSQSAGDIALARVPEKQTPPPSSPTGARKGSRRTSKQEVQKSRGSLFGGCFVGLSSCLCAA
eukprot:TRINITY_DN45456_c0_g1_i1.p1 TRINITY_DN45456_c0_g1~~TRINITY_DN45456_c0_g1_i1.p1  ORF type:complete len:311 (-),score=74.79 TRINITY_DN45456_c0_g1_i1:375-1307(-)